MADKKKKESLIEMLKRRREMIESGDITGDEPKAVDNAPEEKKEMTFEEEEAAYQKKRKAKLKKMAEEAAAAGKP